MRKITGLLAALLLVFCRSNAVAQQDPLYGLYINNPLVLNPATSGIYNNLAAAMSFRNQWGGFDGNPTTLAASGNISLRDNKMGAGLLIINDRIGEVSNTSMNASYAYKLNFENQVFSFGMQAGLMNYKTDPGQLSLINPDDPTFGVINETKFNLGAGAMLKSEKYLIGFSIPHLMSSSLQTAAGAVNIYQQHFYLMGSYIYFLNERILLKPAALIKGVQGAPISVDFNFNINIDRNYTVGAFTRNLKSYGVQAQMNFLEKYKLSYVFELPSNSSVGTRFTTHEVMISFRTAVFDYHDWSISNF